MYIRNLKIGEKLIIGDKQIEVEVKEIRYGFVKLQIKADKEIPVKHQRIQRRG